MTLRRAASWFAFALVLIAPAAVSAQDRFPEFTAPVVDAADVVPDDAEERVNAGLLDYQRRSGNQIAVAVVESIGEASVEDYAEDLFDAWGVGEEDKDNGALLVVAMEERLIRIEVGYGLEGDLTDLESGRIIREHITPRMRAGDVGEAIEAAATEIRRALGDPDAEAVPVAQPVEEEDDRSWFPLVFGVVPFLLVLSAFGRRGRRRRRWDLAPIFWGGGWGGSSGGGLGGGGFGGGGFGGGGGGGSGGGGASGGW